MLNSTFKNYFYAAAAFSTVSVLSTQLTAAPSVPLSEKEVSYGISDWKASYGNHRALITVSEDTDAVHVHIPWRRRDTDASNKDVMVIDSKTGEQVNNRLLVRMSRESADIIFQPTSGAGQYEVYYLIRQRNPNPIKGPNQGHFPGTVYTTPTHTASPEWINKHQLQTTPNLGQLKSAVVKEIQALRVTGPKKLETFNSFYPMEVCATAAEVKALHELHSGSDMLIFPEDRSQSIRMQKDIPLRWIKQGPRSHFSGDADKNEFYPFQLGVYALKQLNQISLDYSDLSDSNGNKIPSSALRCINLGGTNYDGKKFKKTLNVDAHSVQALWLGIDIPTDTPAGKYSGVVTINAEHCSPLQVNITINVSENTLIDKGDSDVWRLSRLRWLDSTIGLDNGVLAPYTPINISGNTCDILGRTIKLSDSGLPTSVVSRISMYKSDAPAREVLARPIDFVVETNSGPIPFTYKKLNFTEQTAGKVSFSSQWDSDAATLTLNGTLECDGYMRYSTEIKAKQDLDIQDIRIELPYEKEVARYLMGRMGVPAKVWKDTYSGFRPTTAEAPIEKGLMYNTVWSGDYNAGLGILLKNQDDQWNGDNKSKHLVPTLPNWENQGQGRYQLKEVDDTALVTVHNGSRSLKIGETARFDFALVITPFKPLSAEHWNYRIYHAPYETEVKLTAAANAKVINVHHANSHNPYINYPFLKDQYLKGFIDECHSKGKKVKLYYTIRELTTRLPEFWALRSLGHEIFIKDEGYLSLTKKPLSVQSSRFHRAGYPWLCEHLIDDYRMRWHSYIKKNDDPQRAKLIGREVDASIATQGLCRWHNYYLEGLKYLMKDMGADGIYLDGIGYDREIMKRVRKTMLLSGKDPMIDFHGAVHQNWMTLAPYIDSIWYGEGTRYDFGPDYWLVEISGIPFGLTGEILKSDRHANIHRGMLYGMTKRLGWRGNRQSEHIWKLWDDFGINDANFIPYFDKKSPVKCAHKDIRISSYVKKGKSLIAIASWAKQDEKTTLVIDWKALGLDPSKVKAYAPAVKGMQTAQEINLNSPLTIPAYNGKLILIEQL